MKHNHNNFWYKSKLVFVPVLKNNMHKSSILCKETIEQKH